MTTWTVVVWRYTTYTIESEAAEGAVDTALGCGDDKILTEDQETYEHEVYENVEVQS